MIMNLRITRTRIQNLLRRKRKEKINLHLNRQIDLPNMILQMMGVPIPLIVILIHLMNEGVYNNSFYVDKRLNSLSIVSML